MAVDNWNTRRRLTALGELIAGTVAPTSAPPDEAGEPLADEDDPAFWDAFSPDEDE